MEQKNWVVLCIRGSLENHRAVEPVEVLGAECREHGRRGGGGDGGGGQPKGGGGGGKDGGEEGGGRGGGGGGGGVHLGYSLCVNYKPLNTIKKFGATHSHAEQSWVEERIQRCGV